MPRCCHQNSGSNLSRPAPTTPMYLYRPTARLAAPLPASSANRVPVIACAPHCRHRPAPVVVGVAIGAARWWHDHPAALGGYEVADEVVGEFVAPRLLHSDGLPRATDRPGSTARVTRTPDPTERLLTGLLMWHSSPYGRVHLGGSGTGLHQLPAG